MAAEYLAKLALRRFLWIQDFAARLADLGAPASVEALLQLGEERYLRGPKSDPSAAAESVWAEWPTEH